MAKATHIPGNDEVKSKVKVTCGKLTYKECLDKESEARYLKKLELLDLKSCPYEDLDGWKDDVRMWPDITYPDIFHYLIDSPGVFTSERMKCYKSLDSYNYFDSGYVRTVFCKKIGKDNMLFKTKVNHSQKSTDPCDVWLATKKDGSVIATHCTCLAGLGEVCSHVGAVLFKLEACVRLGLNKVACTSKPCSWNQQFNKKVDPVCLVNIDFTQPKRSRAGKIKANPDENMGTPKRRPKVPQPLSDQEKENFLHSLHSHGCNSVVLTTHDLLHTSYVPKPVINDMRNAVIPKPLTERFREQGVNLTKDEIVRKCEDIVKTFSVTESEADYVELVTQNQADSMKWFEQRVGRITASKVYDVLRTNQDSPAKSLLQNICTLKYTKNNGKSGVASLDWGTNNEELGVADLMEALEGDHQNLSVSKCGFYINPKYPYLGASPDRIITCDCCGRGGVEVKCPFSQKDVSDVTSITGLYFDENLRLKKNHQYYFQIQTQLNICNLDHLYFVLWTPQGSIISFETKDVDWFNSRVNILERFFKVNILPVLVTGRIEWQTSSANKLNSPLKEVQNKPSEKYCSCNGEEDGREMVRCSNFRVCRRVWYHLECLNLDKAPKGRWLCPYCKK